MSTILNALVDRLNLQKVHRKNNELWCLCPNPNHDDTIASNFSFNLATGMGYCFACNYKTTVIKELQLKGLDHHNVYALWKSISIELEEDLNISIPAKPLNQFLIDEYFANGFSSYALERIKDCNVLMEYDVVSDESDNPIFFTKDFEGNFRSVWVRCQKWPKYLLLSPLSAKRDGCLFGMQLPPTDYTIIVEGFFDALVVREETKEKAVAMMGVYPTNEQLRNLVKMSPLMIMMDGDKAGRLARDYLVDKIPNEVELYVCGKYNGDPDENRERLKDIIKNAMSRAEYLLYRNKL